MMLRTARAAGQTVCRTFTTTAALHEKIPPWLHEKLTSEGYSLEEIRKHGPQLVKKQHHVFQPDTVFKMHKHYEFSLSAYKKYRKEKEIEDMRNDQSFLKDRLIKLGGELSAATFLVHRGAAVKFHDRNGWVAVDEEKDDYDLPRVFTRGYVIEAIDMRDFHIIHRGFENLAHCEDIRSISLRNQPHIDDWCLDAISGMFNKTLEYIDISGCPQVTQRGLCALHRCKNLKVVYMKDLPNVKDAELVTIYLEDALPNTYFEGVDYWKDREPEPS